jgi:hypothetical protein
MTINKKTKAKQTTAKSSKEVITYYLHPLDQSIIINDHIIKYMAISSHCDKHLEHGIDQNLIIELLHYSN